MDNAGAEAAMYIGAIGALFGALLLALRQGREDFKALYEREKEDHKETRKEAAIDSRANSKALQELADFLHELPRRQEDYENASSRRRDRT